MGRGVSLGGNLMSSPIRSQIASELDRAVRQAGVVVWQDEHREYVAAARSIAPSDVPFVAYDGSWFGLRWKVEHLLASEKPPQLVVYASAPAPADDPLAEIRALGKQFKHRLSNLVRQSLTGQLAASRIDQIARDARTLEEAEAAVGGSGSADVRLMSILGSDDSVQMALAVLDGSRDDAIDREGAWTDIAKMLGDSFGGFPTGVGSDLRISFAQQILLSELARAAGRLPADLSSAWTSPTAEQGRRVDSLIQTWRYAPKWSATYRDLAVHVDQQLDLRSVLVWADGLSACFSVPSIESLCMAEVARQLEAGDHGAASVLAEQRLVEGNPWRDERPGQSSTRWSDQWRAVRAVTGLHRSLVDHVVPPGFLPALFDWYVETGHSVDLEHRRLELARGALASHGVLEQYIAKVRVAYEQWVDILARAVSSNLSREGLSGTTQIPQGEIHDRFIKNAVGPTAYIWVDALRYELGAELVEAIQSDISEHVSLYAATAGAPTITKVGMTNLLPAAAARLSVELDEGRLSVALGEHRISTVEHRVEMLRAAHGPVANLDLGTVSQQGEKELARAIKGANLVLVRSQEIDAAGESGLLNTAWPQFEATKQDLANAVAKLGQVGIRRVVITADHGFVALSQSVGDPRTIDAPIGGDGELHRRCWVGKGGTTADGTVRIALAELGIRSDLDIIAPKGVAVFKAGGGKQFFHGGLSPQELIVPVIIVDLEPVQEPQKLDISVTIAGGRITTGVFAATVEFLGDLFTDAITFRVVVRGGSGKGSVARVVSGDGYEPESGSVTIAPGKPTVLTFQVVSNLERNSQIELQVVDARTGRRIAESVAPVAAPIVVEEEL
jgi:hypothetical protein